MLLSCSFSNFKSFKEPVYFELTAPKNRVRNRYPGNYVELPVGERVLKDAVIAGENAGGKSNFVAAFTFLRSLFVRNDISPRAYRNLVFSGSLPRGEVVLDSDGLDASKQPFELELAADGYILRYSLELDAYGVVSEKLECKDDAKGPYELIFSRTRQGSPSNCNECETRETCDHRDASAGCTRYTLKVNAGPEISESLIEDILNKSEGGGLTVVLLATLGESRCRSVVRWFASELVIARRDKGGFLIEGISAEDRDRIMRDPRYFEIFRLVDSSIVEVRIDSERPFLDSVVVRKSRAGASYERQLRHDSTGVAQFAQWALAIYLVVFENKVVLADEVDSAINPVLTDRVIAYINGHDHRGQFVFTTHNAFNLTLRTFMKEQIYFVTKDVETLESTLYSLADFKDIRYDTRGEVYELYLRGLLGGTQDA